MINVEKSASRVLCRRCAKRIYEWKNRDIFDELHIEFANMYEKDTGFTKATTTLRSGGVIMSLFSVNNHLVPLIKKEDQLKLEGTKEREKKDQQEAGDWKKWQQINNFT